MKTSNTERENSCNGRIFQPCLNSDINGLKEDYLKDKKSSRSRSTTKHQRKLSTSRISNSKMCNNNSPQSG